ncbi:MAG: hypothetical protein K0S07_1301 [Chlamydiales bacterium]|nr:hypothetical protein [Chlamydiales bacterium]
MHKINWCQTINWSSDQLESLRNAAFAYVRQGKYDIAATFFKALTVLDAESAYDFQTLGAIYLELGQPQQAIQYLERALQIDGDHTPTLLNLCKAFFSMDRIEEGLKLAALLQKEDDLSISSTATALILAWE